MFTRVAEKRNAVRGSSEPVHLHGATRGRRLASEQGIGGPHG